MTSIGLRMHPIHLGPDATLDDWRAEARRLLAADVPPEQVFWSDFASPGLPSPAVPLAESARPGLRVPARFVETARLVACARADDRWALLYRVLWRLVHGEPDLLDDVVDDDVHRLLAAGKSVSRDAHKMKAFVRFRRVDDSEAGERYVAWHRPDHRIVRLVAPWFRGRFGAMRWSILTPDAAASWDGTNLTYGPGVPRSAAPQGDELEDLWRTYYASVFNPARVKLRAMRRELPVRHWPTLPETELIPELLRQAPARVEEMMKRQSHSGSHNAASGPRISAGETNEANCPTGASAAEFIPKTTSLAVMREAVNGCRGCAIYCNATQGVFGEGPKDATVMFVGEQPGDQEDRAGKPFVGPAGQMLNDGLAQAGVPRGDVYVTNAVKHFKWEPRGTRRLHAKPSAREVGACRPWLEAEIALVKPQLIVCLGATAAQSLLGPTFRITKQRGEMLTGTKWAPAVTATYHPSALLRIPDEAGREKAYREFVEDLTKVAGAMKTLATSTGR